MKYPKVVLSADRTLMSPYRGISLASFFGCAPAIDLNRSHDSLVYKVLRNQVTPMTFTYGRKQTSYDEFYNRELHMRINRAKERTGSKAKVVAGASGTWQYNYDPGKIEEYGLYGIIEGELGGIGPELDGAGSKFFDALIQLKKS